VFESIKTFGRTTHLVETRDFDDIVSLLAERPAQSAFFCNVHMLMLSQEDSVLADAMNSADCVFADGVPVSWLQKKVSGRDAKVIRGYEIMLAVCERAVKSGEKVGLIGSTDVVMNALVNCLCEQYEGLDIVYRHCPPFMEGELISTPQELQNIQDSQTQWLFVGLGCPKQEKWIAKYSGDLNCHILGVGAAFDWISGQVSMPPKWMESSGLGWLYRLLRNPLRMWHRYIAYNSRFLIRVIRLSVGKQLNKDK
jgi:N-acetylglucosaminyldiphosphoundecaprenol N-acetyl-beta-D-mannosaminyltransferase